jgi:hypothetical protein
MRHNKNIALAFRAAPRAMRGRGTSDEQVAGKLRIFALRGYRS